MQVSPGDNIRGVVAYNGASANSYTLNVTVNGARTSQMTIPIQKGPNGQPKVYNHAWVVLEKVGSCDQYPPSNSVVFYDIEIEFDGEVIEPTWTTSYVDNACNSRAHILNSTAVEITWQS